MKKIKLCFISFLAYPLFNSKVNAVFGGAEVDLYNLARKFSEDWRTDITFYVGDFGQEQEEKHGDIRVRKFNYMNLEAYKDMRYKLLRQFNIIKEVAAMDYDICFIEAYNEMLGWTALLPAKLKKTKLVFRLAHDLDTDLVDAKSKGYLYYRLYKYGINKADYIISQTEIQKKMLKDNLGRDSKVIKNGFFINDNINFNEKKYILWVARAQEWKRPELFLKLVKELPEEEFIMIMPGENQVQAKVKSEAGKLPNLRFVDYVPFSEVQKYYDGAKLFVNTSEYEGFPNAFVQACLGKTPILSFNVNPDNFIEANNLGFFCREDMGQAIEFVRSFDREKLIELGENASNYVKANHDITVIYRDYKNIVEQLLG